jgi:lysozyme family protein
MATKSSNTGKKAAGASAVVASILAAVFLAEGGYVNDKNDPGGETNFGITKTTALKFGYTASMRDLPKELAASIYFEDYIQKPGYEPFVTLSPAVAEELVDTGVNTGPARPSRWLQTALNSLNRQGRDYAAIPVDGKVGPGTIAAYEGLVRIRGPVTACELVIKLLDAQQATYYMSLDKLGMFTPGWVQNRIGNVPLSHCAN